MKFTRRKIIDIYNLVESVADKVVSPKLAFKFIKLKQACKPEIDAIVEAQKTVAITPEIEAYNKKQMELDKTAPDYTEKSMTLYEENKELVEDFRKKDQEFGEMLNEEVEIEVPEIDLDSLPEGVFKVKDLELLSEIIG